MHDEADKAMAALDEAIKVCGDTIGAFAAAISTPALPVSASKVSMWKARRSVPAEYVPAIYRATCERGAPVACERFKPRTEWSAVRCGCPAQPFRHEVATAGV